MIIQSTVTYLLSLKLSESEINAIKTTFEICNSIDDHLKDQNEDVGEYGLFDYLYTYYQGGNNILEFLNDLATNTEWLKTDLQNYLNACHE